MKCTALPTACRSASSLACLFAVMCRAAVLPCCRVGLRHRRVVRSRPSHLSGISLFALITHQVGPDLMCLCLFPPRHFLFPRGSGEFGHGQGTTGPGAPAKMRRWTSQAETMHLSVRWRGTVAGRARRGWVASQSLGTGEQGAPAGPPKRRPARKSLLIPCVAKTLAVFWQTFPSAGLEGAGQLGGKQKTYREGQVRWLGRCGRSGRGHCWDITYAVKMDGAGPIFGRSDLLRTGRREERNRSFYRQGPRTQEQEGTQSKAASEAESCFGISWMAHGICPLFACRHVLLRCPFFSHMSCHVFFSSLILISSPVGSSRLLPSVKRNHQPSTLISLSTNLRVVIRTWIFCDLYHLI